MVSGVQNTALSRCVAGLQIYPEQDSLCRKFRLPEPGVLTSQNAKRNYKLDSLSSPSPQINPGHLCLVASELLGDSRLSRACF